LYAIGKTGTGKSTLIYTTAVQDLAGHAGLALFDPHGDLSTSLVHAARIYRPDDHIYLNPADSSDAFRFNPLASVHEDRRPQAAAGLIEVFKKIWHDDWGPRLEHLLRNVIFTLLEIQGSTIADIPPLLTNKAHRERVAAQLENQAVKDFWETEYARYSGPFRAVIVAPLQNKIGALLTDPVLRRVFTGDGPQLDIRDIMDSGKCLIVNLDKGRLGEGPASILGSFLVSHIALAGLARSEQSEAERRDFFVYLDEFHTFTTQALATMLSELRKYKVGLILAHQHLSQLDPAIRSAIFGNIGTLISFRVGAADAAYLAREFAPTFSAQDLTSLPRYNMYLRLQIDGEQSRPFSARTLSSLDEIPGFRPSAPSA
jgi:type IV secretory pathway VirB4 component